MTITQSDTVTGTITARSNQKANAVAVPSLKSAATASTPDVFYDSVVSENANAVTWNEFQIQTALGRNFEIENLSVCQTLIDGVVAPVGNGGVGRLRVTDGSVANILKCDTKKRGEQTYRVFSEYEAGTVSRYLFDQVEPLFYATPDVDYFATYDHAASTYTRNASCWGASIDFACVAVGSNNGGGWTRERGGVLITSRHVLIAWHYPYGTGTQLRFANAAGVVETRTVVGTSYATRAGDYLVCTLNAPVTIATACEIAGPWLVQDVRHANGYASWYSGGVLVHLDKNANIYAGGVGFTRVRDLAESVTMTVGGVDFVSCAKHAFCTHDETGPIPSAFAAMRNSPVSGDSGQPVFIIIEGEPVLIWAWTFPSGGTPTYLHNGAVLNALIAVSDANAGISTGLTVTVAPDPTL